MRVLAMLLIGAACVSAQEHAHDSRFTIDNTVSTFDASKVESTAVGYQHWFVDKAFVDGRTLKMSVVGPHQATHEPHQHAEDEFFFVLEGRAEFFLNGRTKEAGAYSSFYCPPNSLHGIRSVSDDTLKYLVVKKYDLTARKR